MQSVVEVNINPLNVYNLRRVTNCCPPHFTTIGFMCENTEAIFDWIYENLEGRFYFEPSRNDKSDSSLIGLFQSDRYLLGFELNSEAVLIALQLDIINK